MRLVTYVGSAAPRVGVVDGSTVIDLAAADAAWGADTGSPRSGAYPCDMAALLEAGAPMLDRARGAVEAALRGDLQAIDGQRLTHALRDVRLLAPLPRPRSLRDFMVVEAHVRGALKAIPDEWFNLPVYYKGNPDEMYGPDDVVPWPAYTDKLDYELELCAVIGKQGRRIPVERAADHIAGYTLFNDWSARDIQLREMSVGIGPGMGKDFANSIGPCIVTSDGFARDEVQLEARVDGELWSSGTLASMRFSFEEIIAWISQEQTLHPGDLLGSGTVGGGCGFELDRWIAQGSVVELHADGIGTLRNRVGVKGAGPSRDRELGAAVTGA